MPSVEKVGKFGCDKGKFKKAEHPPYAYCEECEYLKEDTRCPDFEEKKVKE